MASAKFGFSWDKVKKSQAFHFKGGQGAKTGTGGHLPGAKVTAEIAAVRGLPIGETAISPATFTDFHGVKDFQKFAKERKITSETIVFNNMVNTKEDFENNWEVPANQSWHKRFLV